MPPRLTRPFYRRDPETLARSLLGQTLVRVLDNGVRLAGRIVEVEAYLGRPDRAAHTFGGRRTPRNESMYLDGGHAYVYFTYGTHWCMNITSDRTGEPTACLIRALDPIQGIDRMREHRAGKISHERLKETDLCSGPAKLTQALKIDRAFDGIDLISDERLFVERGRRVPEEQIVIAPRIGIANAGEWTAQPLRYYVKDNPHVSKR